MAGGNLDILVLGGGGREHAIVKALAKSPRAGRIFAAPGNGGICRDAQCVAIERADEIVAFCRKEAIGLVVVGPEKPLVDGVTDALREAGIPVFGPSKAAAMLEASKGFTKDLCRKYGIPTAGYARFGEPVAAKEYLASCAPPIVIKADGLAAGKGVVIAATRQEAGRVIDEMFGGPLAANAGIVIEEFLEGEELSFFALCHGVQVVEFGSAQDHKAAYDGDKGPNTGGMGAYAPAPVASAALRQEIMARIIAPTAQAMVAEGMPYHGVLFAGIMVTKSGPQLIEYNARFGDPETQALLSLLEDDLPSLLENAALGRLPERVRFAPGAAVCVVMAAEGYPGSYEKGGEIRYVDRAEKLPGVTVYHAGTRARDKRLLADGGRVLGVTATGADVADAQRRAYEAIDMIEWKSGFCRRDIGWRAI